jgi:lipoprotein LprG
VHPSAFEGTFELSVNGLPADADVIAVDGKTYARNSLLLPQWTPIDPSDYGAPDPAKLMEPDGGFSGLLASAKEVEAGDSVRGGEDNKEILTEYTGTISSDAVAALIPDAEGDFTFSYTISDDDELREAVLEGAFYGADNGDVTYTLTLDDYGTEKDITAP